MQKTSDMLCNNCWSIKEFGVNDSLSSAFLIREPTNYREWLCFKLLYFLLSLLYYSKQAIMDAECYSLQ